MTNSVATKAPMLSGIPRWNTDTGGFFGNGSPRNPQYQELYSRRFQFSAFCPMFRVPGSYGLRPGKEFRRFDEKTRGIRRSCLDLLIGFCGKQGNGAATVDTPERVVKYGGTAMKAKVGG